MIDFERWDEVKPLVQGALDLPEEEREAYLDEACQGDQELRRQAGALLAVSATQADAYDNFVVMPPSFHAADFKEGDEIGPYRIVRPLGTGGMSTVYLADDPRHKRQVALKVLKRPRRRRHEEQTVARFDHSNIVTFHDSGQIEAGPAYFVMEYVDGEAITTYCEARGLSIDERLRLFLAVCDAVAYAHRHLVVHRDLKPSNILVTEDGKPKLLDFGIAKNLRPSFAEVTATAPEDRALTVAFASPEQLSGEDTSTSTDIYSLGVLLCLMLTGRLPYPVKSYQDLPWAIRNMEPEKPSQLVLKNKETTTDEELSPSSSVQGSRKRFSRRLRGDLDAIILKSLRKEPERRYQTVAELSEDIQRYLKDEPVIARKGSRRYRAWKFWHRHWKELVATATAFLLTLGLAIGYFMQYHEASRQRDEARKNLLQANEITTLLKGIFEIADPYRENAETLTAQDLLERASQQIKSPRVTDPLVRASLLETIGEIFVNLGLYDRSLPLLETALSIRQDLLGRSHLQSVNSLNDLAVALARHGEHERARTLHLEAASLLRSSENPDPLELSRTLVNIATTSLHLDDFQAADNNYKSAMRIRRQVLPSDDIIVADCLDGLARLRREQGRFPEAEDYYEETLTLKRKLLGHQHPSIATTLGNLGFLLIEEHKIDEAETHLRESLTIRIARLGEDHPDVAIAKDNLARALYEKGDYRTAKRLSEEALTLRIKLLGPRHPSVASSLTALGTMALKWESLDDAETYFRKAFYIYSEVYGRSHSSTTTALNNIANVLLYAERYREAERLFREVLSLRQQIYGRENVKVAESLYHLGKVLTELGEMEEAHRLFDEALLTFQRELGPEHPKVAHTLCKKAVVFIRQERYREAHDLARQCYTIIESQLSPDHPHRSDAATVLGTALVGLGQYTEAESLLLDGFVQLRASKEPSSLSIRRALEQLVTLYDRWGKQTKAAEYRKLLAEAGGLH
jgi:tetratricopeptide (TPR) repeat protein